jgi:hypothetical protein
MESKNIELLNNKNDQKISTNYETFRQKIIKKAKTSKSLFKAHLFSFLSINGFLAFLNIITPGTYPWFLFPLGSMAMLLSIHYFSKNDRARQKIDIEKYPVLTDKAFKLLKKLFRKRRFTNLSTIFTISVSAFLFLVNFITGPGYLWAAIPSAALASLSSTIWFFNKHKRTELIQEFRLLAAEKRFIQSSDFSKNALNAPVRHPSLIEAYTLKETIIKQLKQIGISQDPLLDTIPELVDTYIQQIKLLIEKNEEFTKILDLNPYEKLLKERTQIVDKMENSDDGQLVTQYKASLIELDKHLAANKKIANKNELLILKTSSALNSIRMLHLELANLNVEKMSQNEVMKILEKNSRDLSERLTDLQSAYSEIEKEISNS